MIPQRLTTQQCGTTFLFVEKIITGDIHLDLLELFVSPELKTLKEEIQLAFSNMTASD